jgi:short-subunit dehydrogenase
MRNWLYHRGVHVTTIKPGFVDTAMTYGLPGLFLVASPESIGEQIVRAIEKKKAVVYLPRFWGGIMAIIKALPEWLFKRLKL